MKEKLTKLIKTILTDLTAEKLDFSVNQTTHANQGDYSTNAAMVAGKVLKRNPLEIAKEIKDKLDRLKKDIGHNGGYLSISQKDQKISEKSPHLNVLQDIERVEIAPPGFINFFLADHALVCQMSDLQKKEDLPRTMNHEPHAKRIMVEFAHPNTHKLFHIGHLRNITTGESIVRLLESQGHKVIRANYQGDVGMHIAKALYALLHSLSSPTRIGDPGNKNLDSRFHGNDIIDLNQKVELLGKAYAAGSKAFEEDAEAKKEILEINKQIYSKDSKVWDLYQITRQWSLEYFGQIYKRVGTHFDRYYFESEVYETGKQIVLEELKKGVFEESDGAIIFPGEKYGLHNRVFITGEGNPTYEGKDIGLAKLQFDEYHPDLVVHVVASEQKGYFEVIFKAIEEMFPFTKGKEYHLVYGFVQLKQGKMSSRTGNIVLGEWLIDEAKKYASDILDKNISKYKKEEPFFVQKNQDYGKAQRDVIAETVAVAAVKYSFLKAGLQTSIAFDFKESVNLEGDSGPYLLYTYARCKSVLKKAKTELKEVNGVQILQLQNLDLAPARPTRYDLPATSCILNPEERAILRQLVYFPEIVAEAAQNYSPNLLCSYLYKLAQQFNLFYAQHSILGTDKQNELRELTDQQKLRVLITQSTSKVLHQGLYLLGIQTLEEM